MDWKIPNEYRYTAKENLKVTVSGYGVIEAETTEALVQCLDALGGYRLYSIEDAGRKLTFVATGLPIRVACMVNTNFGTDEPARYVWNCQVAKR